MLQELKKQSIITCNLAEKMCDIMLIVKLSLLAGFISLFFFNIKIVSPLNWISYSAASARS